MQATINNPAQAAAGALERAQKLAVCATTDYLLRFAGPLRGEG